MKVIINDIHESICSLEVSELLKRKRFNVYGYLEEVWLWNSYKTKKEIPVFGLGSSSKLPTHALAIEWIRQNFKIYICITQPYSDSEDFACQYRFEDGVTAHIGAYKSPQEATEIALKYVLTELIK